MSEIILGQGREFDARTKFTAGDAMVCKFSAASKGYFEDRLLAPLIDKEPSIAGASSTQPRKPPIINRGYYARVYSINQTIEKFMNAADLGHNKTKQIVNLGSGFDTLSLRLHQKEDDNLHTFEIDFEEIVRKKVNICLSDPIIKKVLIPTEKNNQKNSDEKFEEKNGSQESVIESSSDRNRVLIDQVGAKYSFGNLKFLAGDLRNANEVIDTLLNAGLDIKAPTLILTECVMVYIEKFQSENLCRAFSELLTDCSWVTYDMITPTDTFGRTMSKNLTSARFRVPGFTDYPTLESQRERFLRNGWTDAKSITMLSVYDHHIGREERHRVARLEIFDEIEEWQMLMSHYSLTVAVKGSLLLDILPV
jgi:tRNA wybutosine-synthesizing protein 4